MCDRVEKYRAVGISGETYIAASTSEMAYLLATEIGREAGVEAKVETLEVDALVARHLEITERVLRRRFNLERLAPPNARWRGSMAAVEAAAAEAARINGDKVPCDRDFPFGGVLLALTLWPEYI